VIDGQPIAADDDDRLDSFAGGEASHDVAQGVHRSLRSGGFQSTGVTGNVGIAVSEVKQ
jgi:hypothetical protein